MTVPNPVRPFLPAASPPAIGSQLRENDAHSGVGPVASDQFVAQGGVEAVILPAKPTDQIDLDQRQLLQTLGILLVSQPPCPMHRVTGKQ